MSDFTGAEICSCEIPSKENPKSFLSGANFLIIREFANAPKKKKLWMPLAHAVWSLPKFERTHKRVKKLAPELCAASKKASMQIFGDKQK